jgi:hypothetical protein
MLWFKGLALAQKIAIGVIAALVAMWILWFAYDLLTASDKVKGRLGQNQADAAISSATDAVGTVGDQAQTEALRERDLDGVKKDVDEADDTSGAHDAGATFLCDNFGICSQE